MKNKIIAHRGVFNNIDIPENSMKAFKKALKLNYPIELDIQLTKDNILVVLHDHTLQRMTGDSRILQELTYDEIHKLNLLNTKEKIPKFSDVLKLINDQVFLDIEIKNTSRIEDTCTKLIEELTNYHNYDIKSFNPKIVKYIKDNYPDITVGYLIDYSYQNKFLNILKKRIFIKYCNPDFIAISKQLLKTKKFRKLSKKYPTMIWTITEQKEITDKDYTYICNNLPFK